jgi:hypothetical protein
MATAPVTLTLSDVVGGHLVGKYPEIIFTLNKANSKAGKMHPTEPAVVSPPDSGVATVNLETTTDMMDDAWYTVAIRWLDAAGNYVKVDYPDWAIQVPPGGGSFSDLFGKPPSNMQMFYVSLSAPEDPRKWTWWLEDDPTDPDNPLNTGNLHQWRDE